MKKGRKFSSFVAGVLVCTMLIWVTPAVALISIGTVFTRTDIYPPTLSYLVIEPSSFTASPATTLVTVTAKFVDASPPIEATATLTPPALITRSLALPILPIYSTALKAKFVLAGAGATLPAGAPAGCMQAKILMPANAKAGTWKLSLQARDSKGNSITWLNPDLEAAGRARTVTVLNSGTGTGDTSPPETYANGVPDTWSKEPVNVTLEASDGSGSGVKTTYYRIGTAAQQIYSTPFTVSAEGTTSLQYWSVDVAGNTEEHQALDVHIDTSAPQISHDAKTSYNGTATITVTASDTGSGLALLAYSLDGGAEEYIEVSGASVQSALTVTASGDHTLAFGVWDLAENGTVTTEAITFTITGGTSGGDETPGDDTLPGTDATPTVAVDGFTGTSAKVVGYGAKAPITGKLTRPDGETEGLLVMLERLVGGTFERTDQGAEADATGAFNFALPAATSKTTYRLTFGEDYGLDPIYSRTFVILPKVKLTLTAGQSAIRRSVAFKIRGTLAPAHAGKPVVVRVEQLRAGKWRIWKNIPVTVAKGVFATSVKFPSTGTWRYSARLVSSDKDHAPTATAARKVKVNK